MEKGREGGERKGRVFHGRYCEKDSDRSAWV